MIPPGKKKTGREVAHTNTPQQSGTDPAGQGRFRSSDGDLLIDLDERGREILGYPAAARLSNRALREVFGIKSSLRKKMISTMRNDSGKFLGELTIQRPDGSTGVLLINEEMRVDGRGRPAGTEGVFVDVTAERKWERELFNIARDIGATLEEGKIIDRIAIDLSRITGCHTCSVVLFDEDGIKVHVRSPQKVGKSVLKTLSMRISKEIGPFLEFAIDSTDMKLDFRLLAGMRSRRTRERKEIRSYFTVPLLVGTDLQGFLHLGSFVPIEFTEKDKRFLLTCATQMAFALQNARSFEKEKKLVQMKSSFLSNLSHALRTPMATMKQSVSLLLRDRGGELNDTQRKFLGIMGENVDRLTGVLNNLLDLSKIEYGSVELNRTEIDMVLLVRSIVNAFEASMINKRIRFSFSAKPSSIKAFVDSEIMRQIIESILGNAVKFTSRNKPIRFRLAGSKKRVMVSVQDRGIGMTKENLAMAFDKYRSFQRGIKAGIKGTGLGLALTKELVELHGGRIWIESKVRMGTEVSFVIPRMPFASIVQEKMKRSMELARIKGEDLILFLYVANPDGPPPTVRKIARLRERLGSYLGPIIGSVGGQMIVDEEEERAAVIAPVKKNETESTERAIKRNFIDVLSETQSAGSSLFSWVRYPEEGSSFADLLKSLLARAGVPGEALGGRIEGGE